MKKLLLCSVLLLSVTACGDSLKGTYSDESGLMTYQFTPGGRVTVATLGGEVEMVYKVEGDKVKIGMPDVAGRQVLSLNDDGSIGNPSGFLLRKNADE